MNSNIRELLFAAYHGDKVTRTTATEQLTELMKSPKSLYYLLELAKAGVDYPSLPVEQSLSALLYVKNSLYHTISSSMLESNAELVKEVQRTLFSGMFVVPESHRKIICACGTLFISSCGWNYLDELIPLVVQASNGGDVGYGHSQGFLGSSTNAMGSSPDQQNEYVKALLELLYTYVKRFMTPFLESCALQFEVLNALVNVMLKFLTMFPQDFFIIRLVFKIMECIMHVALNMNAKRERKLLDSKPDLFDEWWQVMLHFLRCYIPPTSDNPPSSGPACPVDRLPRSPATGTVDPLFVACVKRVAKITLAMLNNAVRRKCPLPCTAHFIGMTVSAAPKTKPSLRKRKAKTIVTVHSDPASVSSSYSHAFMLVWEDWIRYCIASHNLSSLQGNHPGEGKVGSTASLELFRKSELFAIDYLKVCTLEESLYRHYILPRAMVLVEQLFLPYLWYNEEDHDVFFSQSEDLSAFTQYMLDESMTYEGEFSTRQAASNAILSLIGGKKAFHAGSSLLLPLVQALGEELQLSNTAANLPKLFGALHLLCILRKHLRSQSDIWHQQMHVVLAQSVAPWVCLYSGNSSGCSTNSAGNTIERNEEEKSGERNEEHAAMRVAVRVKAIYVCQRYAKVPMPSEDVFSSFVQTVCLCMHDKDPRIRLSGIEAICTFVSMKRARAYLSSYLSVIIAQCLEFLPKTHTAFIPTALLYITTYFAPEIVPMFGSLCHTLVQQFLAISFDLNAMESEGLEDGVTAESGLNMLGGSKSLQQYDAMAASGDVQLQTIESIVGSCENAEETKELVTRVMLPDLLRLFHGVLDDTSTLSLDILEKILHLLSHTVNSCSQHIPSELWELLPLVFQTVESGVGVDAFDSIEAVLDNFLSSSPLPYLSNPQLVELSIQSAEKMLLGGVVASEPCIQAAPQLWEAMLHQAKGQVVVGHAGGSEANASASSSSLPPGLLDPFLPRMLSTLLQGLAQSPPVDSTGDVQTRIWILTAVMDCFYYNAALSLSVLLENEGAAVAFFQGFFHIFRGCIPQMFESGEVNNSGGSDSHKRIKGKKKKRIMRFDEGKEVVSCLSILTRKVIILGLSSLLSYLHSEAISISVSMMSNFPMNAVQGFISLFFTQFLPQANALIEYCITTNYELYVKRCDVATDQLTRIASGEVDDSEEVDEDDDAILCINSGLGEENEEDVMYDEAEEDFSSDEEEDSGEGVSGASAHHYDIDVDEDDDGEYEKRSQAHGNESGLGFWYDEADDYSSPIDDVNEVEFFLHCWLQKLPLPPCFSAHAVADGSGHGITGASGILKTPEEYSQFGSTANAYRQLSVELERAMKREFSSRLCSISPLSHDN